METLDGGVDERIRPHFLDTSGASQIDGSTVVLNGIFEADAEVLVKWYKEDEKIEENCRYHIKCVRTDKNIYKTSLQVQMAEDFDSGIYRCEIGNSNGRATFHFNLSLKGFSSPTFIKKPNIIQKEDSVTLNFGISCKIPMSVNWFKNGVPINPQSAERYSFEQKQIGQWEHIISFIVQKIDKSDYGCFEAIVSTESGNLAATFEIKFQTRIGAPSFYQRPSIGSTYVEDVAVIDFTVYIKSDHQIRVTWYHPNGEVIRESDKFKLLEVFESSGKLAKLHVYDGNKNDSGKYLCTVENEHGKAAAELDVRLEVDEDSENEEEYDATRMFGA